MPTLKRTLSLRKIAYQRGNGSSSSNCTRVADLLSLFAMTCTVDPWPTMGCLKNMSFVNNDVHGVCDCGNGICVYSSLEFLDSSH